MSLTQGLSCQFGNQGLVWQKIQEPLIQTCPECMVGINCGFLNYRIGKNHWLRVQAASLATKATHYAKHLLFWTISFSHIQVWVASGQVYHRIISAGLPNIVLNFSYKFYFIFCLVQFSIFRMWNQTSMVLPAFGNLEVLVHINPKKCMILIWLGMYVWSFLCF